MLDLIRQDDSVREYFEAVEHLIVDEAQDIVGPRAELILEMIRKLSPHCGVTVFADEAQAIYGFADDREVGKDRTDDPPLPEKIRQGTVGEFREFELSQVHRTASPQLLKIFSDIRRKVLTVGGENGDKLEKIRKEVSELAHGEAPSLENFAQGELKDAFVLYRRRCDVLLTASILTQKGIPHRVRMSGLPVCLAPWIGATLAEHTEADLSRDTFVDLWADRVNGTSLATIDVNEAWALLFRIAGPHSDRD